MTDKKDGRKMVKRLELNPDDYRDELTEFDLTKEQQDALLESLWHIMSMMVDIGWGVEHLGILLPEIFQKAGQDSSAMVKQKDQHHIENKTGE